MGLGTFPGLSLAAAREAAVDIQRRAREGVDPIETRKERRREAALEKRTKTFRDCAEQYIALNEVGWSNPKHRQQWRNTLATYAYPVFGARPVGEISVSDVLQVIKPLWQEKTETASRLRGRIEAILSWAIVRGLREGPNPAVWRGHLDAILPPKARVRPVTHHRALDFLVLPAFMADLCTRRAPSARALEFTILTAARSAEVRFATWSEIDFERRLWIVPAHRIKTRREHRVPLGARCLDLLGGQKQDAANYEGDALIFPSGTGKAMSDAVYRALFARMGYQDITAHGFRSSFRDWVGETTSFPRELAEQALAHRAGDAVELAYRRGDALEKRRVMMAAWEAFALGETDDKAVTS